MGMFDDIHVDALLPDMGFPVTTADFQTKDFECLMDHYIITADGKLLRDGAPVLFHGLLNFYHYDTKIDTWWEYEAKFTDGTLVDIKPVECRKLVSAHPNIKHHTYFPSSDGA